MAVQGADTETTRHIYFCKWCAWTFEASFDAGTSAPETARCPVCDAPDAHRAGAADESTRREGIARPGPAAAGHQDPRDAENERDDDDEEAAAMKYVYYCERCRNTFEVEVDPEKPIPPETVCARCEYPHALKAFAASTMRPQAGGCAPSSGC